MAQNDEACPGATGAAPQQEHRWLQKFVGEWNFEVEAFMQPGQPPERFKGRERVRSLGGFWILGEGEGEMPGGGVATTLLTLGYDPPKQRFVGTWVGSMMTHLWIYNGALDAAQKILTLDTEGPDMSGAEALAKFRDVFEVRSDDHRILTSHMLGADGAWYSFMTANYRRTK